MASGLMCERQRSLPFTFWIFRASRSTPSSVRTFTAYICEPSGPVPWPKERTPQVAFDLPSVDRGMEWGYAWEAGPFKQMDLLGLDFLRAEFRNLKLAEPELGTVQS